ncbi:hypothetical protein psal_cds_803 [Pandoravirus salinus]|uniref:Uncharacterized protein n=1 Tax=Pandoravirus salinus TaxID=1349410 RepID=S4W2Q1_9VIRU|nr:hypothetical protein psal_cds_803 [Pandoravirus salinus]AGO84827.1 hypothetical protein psal_cds_803 [Pandoravirus salinus]
MATCIVGRDNASLVLLHKINEYGLFTGVCLACSGVPTYHADAPNGDLSRTCDACLNRANYRWRHRTCAYCRTCHQTKAEEHDRENKVSGFMVGRTGCCFQLKKCFFAFFSRPAHSCCGTP